MIQPYLEHAFFYVFDLYSNPKIKYAALRPLGIKDELMFLCAGIAGSCELHPQKNLQ